MNGMKRCSKCGKMYMAWRCPRCYKGKGRVRSSSTRRKSFRASDVLHRHSGDLPVGHSIDKPKLISPLDVIEHVAKKRGKGQMWVSARVNDSWEFAAKVAQRFNARVKR